MPLRNSSTSSNYGSVTKLFHWSMALLIISMLALGLYMTEQPRTPDTIQLYGLHKSIGVLVLILVALRFPWRLLNAPPALPETMARWQKFSAGSTHVLLYLLMFLMPLTGWLLSSSAGFPVSMFGWFTLPNLTGDNHDLHELMESAHYWLAWIMIAAITAHVLAALLHHFHYRDRVLKRMLPFSQGA